MTQPPEPGKFLFVGGPSHALVMPIDSPGIPVTDAGTGTKYQLGEFTRSEPHPVTGEPIPMYKRAVYIHESLWGLDVADQVRMANLADAVMTRWFREGTSAMQDNAVNALVTPAVEFEVTCAEGGPECFTERNASKARVSKAAWRHNEQTGHKIDMVERLPEPPSTVEGVEQQ